jgi:hypothetical protein
LASRKTSIYYDKKVSVNDDELNNVGDDVHDYGCDYDYDYDYDDDNLHDLD